MGQIFQLCGLSGAGKTTLANAVQRHLEEEGFKVMIIDGDVYRQSHCKDLGFSKTDRLENIARLGNIADQVSNEYDFILIAAINPFEEGRRKLSEQFNAPVIWLKCELGILIERDTKGLYKKALLPDHHPDKIINLTGINDTFEEPSHPALLLHTDQLNEQESLHLLATFIKSGV